MLSITPLPNPLPQGERGYNAFRKKWERIIQQSRLAKRGYNAFPQKLAENSFRRTKMIDYTNDQEQWEAIKAWWKANGRMLVIVIVLGLALSFGFQFWRQHKIKQSETASALYDQMLAGYTAGSAPLFQDLAKDLENNYSATPYASLAALFEAKNAAEKGDLDTALQKLQWAGDHAKGKSWQQIARIRAARVLLAQHKPDAALTLLQKVDDEGFLPEINEVKGDVYLTQGKLADARVAYQAALQSISGLPQLKSDLQMKLEQLPTK